MRGYADKVLQKKSVLLEDNSGFTPHNKRYQRVNSDQCYFFSNRANFISLVVSGMITAHRATIKYKLNLMNQPVTGCSIWLTSRRKLGTGMK